MRNQQSHQQLSRRRFLSASLLAGGAGLVLPDVLRLRALAAEEGKAAPDTAVIQIWRGGGPSQFETFDPKPLAPAEIRGQYKTISSKLPGAPVCEMLPLTAGVLDKTAVIRSFTHEFDDHFARIHVPQLGPAGGPFPVRGDGPPGAARLTMWSRLSCPWATR